MAAFLFLCCFLYCSGRFLTLSCQCQPLETLGKGEAVGGMEFLQLLCWSGQLLPQSPGKITAATCRGKVLLWYEVLCTLQQPFLLRVVLIPFLTDGWPPQQQHVWKKITCDSVNLNKLKAFDNPVYFSGVLCSLQKAQPRSQGGYWKLLLIINKWYEPMSLPCELEP